MRCRHSGDGRKHRLDAAWPHRRCSLCRQRCAQRQYLAAECEFGQRLRKRLLRAIDLPEAKVLRIVNDVIAASRASREARQVLLVEVAAGRESVLSDAVAALGGMALRIVEPSGVGWRAAPAPLKRGQAVCWPLDLLDRGAVGELEAYLGGICMCSSHCYHVHFSCMCVGTTKLRAAYLPRASNARLRYHGCCRALLYKCRGAYQR